MEGVLWHVLGTSRGAPSRVQIVRLLDDQPRNPNQLAETLELDYTTIRHHLDVLESNSVVERATEGYGAIYMITDQTRDHWDVVETVMASTEDGP